MKTTRALLTVMLAAGLLLSGCSSGQGGDGKTASTSGEAAGRSAAAEKQRHRYVDPCSLLDSGERAVIAGSYAGTKLSAGLFPTAVEFNTCSVPTPDDDFVVLRYGYAVSPVPGFRRFVRQQRNDESTRATRLDGVGDEAWLLVSTSYREAWVRSGEHTMVVSTTEQFPVETARQVLQSMLDKATPGMLEHPIQLPSACLPANHTLVVGALGRAATRALGVRRGKHLACDYATSKRRITLTASPKTTAQLDKGLAANRSVEGGLVPESEEFRLVPKSLTRLSAGDEPYAYTYLHQPSALLYVAATTSDELGDGFNDVTFDQAGFRALNRTWVRRQAERLRK